MSEAVFPIPGGHCGSGATGGRPEMRAPPRRLTDLETCDESSVTLDRRENPLSALANEQNRKAVDGLTARR